MVLDFYQGYATFDGHLLSVNKDKVSSDHVNKCQVMPPVAASNETKLSTCIYIV